MDIGNEFLIGNSLALLAMKDRDIIKFERACSILKDSIEPSVEIGSTEYLTRINSVVTTLIDQMKKVLYTVTEDSSKFAIEDVNFILQCIEVSPLTIEQKAYRKLLTNYSLGRPGTRDLIKTTDINECPPEFLKELLAIKLFIANDELDYSEIVHLVDIMDSEA